ncbi:hypothetical protein C5167_031416 [Papaver somniferum]|uniref:4Fe-4S ferredoxin-type domain-containing protein n=1 Tax=Papaver somniferum TaxID=3469 RepID=A0A4Y7K7H2_PAPSO|nr:uncharacterized protein LOC113292915 [Papaver somniferum]RZC68161.1 hypothetical protein C5167_031416 [Papaver somniferum]
MAQRISSSFLVGFLVIAIVLLSFSEMGSAQTFTKTCQKNGGIVKGVKAAENCDVCRGECDKQCPEGYFLLESRFCFTTPCPQPNPVLKNGVCTVLSPYTTSVTCSCCCVNKYITE